MFFFCSRLEAFQSVQSQRGRLGCFWRLLFLGAAGVVGKDTLWSRQPSLFHYSIPCENLKMIERWDTNGHLTYSNIMIIFTANSSEFHVLGCADWRHCKLPTKNQVRTGRFPRHQVHQNPRFGLEIWPASFPSFQMANKKFWRCLQAMRMFLPRVNGVSESKRACEANSWRRLRGLIGLIGLIAETRPLSHFWDLTNIQKYGDSINKQEILSRNQWWCARYEDIMAVHQLIAVGPLT